DPTTTATRPNQPANALPQRTKFATQTQTITAASHNTTQPFTVNVDTNDLDQQQQSSRQQRPTANTSTRRRQNRRNRQQQYHNTADNYNPNYNKFTELSEADASTDIESNYDDDIKDAAPSINKNNNNNKTKQQTEQNRNNKKKRSYLEPNRIMRYMQDNASPIISSRGNQAYILASTTIYDDWIRDNYDLQVWQNYLKMGTDDKHWAKEVIKGTKKRDDIINSRFVKKKINRFTTNITRASANISNLQVQLTTYWTQTITNGITSTTSAAATTTANSNRTREPAERLEKFILKYIQNCTQHVKRMAENKILLARAEMEEHKALEVFEQIASPTQWNAHLFLKPKMKSWNTKNKNYLAATKRVEYDLPPKFISNIDFTFKIDESIFNKDEAQTLYNQMRQLTKDYRTQAMSLYLQSTTREQEILADEIKNIIVGFPKEENNTIIDTEDDLGYIEFKHYNELRRASRGRTQRTRRIRCPDSHTIVGRGFLAPTIMNEAKAKLTVDEYQLLKLGPRFIYNDPRAASRRRATELAVLKRKIETRFFEKKVSPGKAVEQFIAELDCLLKNLHDTPAIKTTRQHEKQREIISYDNLLQTIHLNQCQITKYSISTEKKKNYPRLVKRLKQKLRSA
ncbi:unnamed protein product, partial [Rotaria socialis]